jgi:hypothetical protein
MSNIAAALVKAQSEMSLATKDSKNPFFKSKYANLNSIREAVLPALNKNGVVVLQPTVYVDGKSFVRTTLLHSSGEVMTSDTEIICSKQNDPQAWGAALSYSRRYSLQSLMCVGAEDDDAESAMDRKTTSFATGTTTTNSGPVTVSTISTGLVTAAATTDNVIAPTTTPSFRNMRKAATPAVETQSEDLI